MRAGSDDMTHENQTYLGRQPTGAHVALIGMLGLGSPSLEPPTFLPTGLQRWLPEGTPFKSRPLQGMQRPKGPP